MGAEHQHQLSEAGGEPWLQFRSPRHHPGTYWFTVAMIAVFGTAAADCFRIGLHVELPYTTTGFWTSYVLTRPLGAPLADHLGMDKPFGVGVGFGTTALLSAAVCAALVGYVGWSHRRLRPLPAPASS